jgi:hypothetical protein
MVPLCGRVYTRGSGKSASVQRALGPRIPILGTTEAPWLGEHQVRETRIDSAVILPAKSGGDSIA